MRILAIVLDFDQWQLGRTWSYSASYAVIDGLRSHGAEVVVVPSLVRAHHGLSNPWVELAPRLLAGQSFDQAWIWVTHSHYSDDFWKWLEATIPVRVAILMESLRYTAEEIEEVPLLGSRYDDVVKQIRHATHVLTYDEQDAKEISDDLGLPSRLFHLMLPESFVQDDVAASTDRITFIGSTYPSRAKFMEREEVADFIDILPGPEADLGLDARFDEINTEHLNALKSGQASLALMASHADGLQAVRRAVLDAVLAIYRSSLAMVNLPALFKGFPSRVFEAMAVGAPVITDLLLHRPLTTALFEDGRHIMYYDANAPSDLRRAVACIRSDAGLRTRIAEGGLSRFRSELTSEVQVGSILTWLPNKLDEYHAVLTKYQRNAEKLFHDYGDRERENQDLQRRVAELEDSLTKASEEAVTSQRQLDSMNDRILRLEHCVATLTELSDNRSSQIALAHQWLADRQETIVGLRNQLKDLEYKVRHIDSLNARET